MADLFGDRTWVLLLLQALVVRCLGRAELSSEGVKYVALHGTGTPLGDPIEVGALSAALQPRGGANGSHMVTFGSNKASNMLSGLNMEVIGCEFVSRMHAEEPLQTLITLAASLEIA